MEVTKQEIADATVEAIYWWNRSENYNHYYFSKIEMIHKDKHLFEFFTQKIFEVFLKDYSVRRNIAKGYKSVDIFLSELLKSDFVKKVAEGNEKVIDKTSNKFRKSNKLSDNEVRSLLSKVAFLINPSVYPLYDSQTKSSLWDSLKEGKKLKLKQLENYSIFLEEIKKLKLKFQNEKLFDISLSILKEYKDTLAFTFFIKNRNAFELRIIDKLLWIKGQTGERRMIDYSQYKKLLSLK